MFDSPKIIRKEKRSVKENSFLVFGFTTKNTKENKI